MATGERLLFVITCYMERAKAFSREKSQEILTPMLGAQFATRFGRRTEALTVSGMRKAKL
jgi:hypothetical protein